MSKPALRPLTLSSRSGSWARSSREISSEVVPHPSQEPGSQDHTPPRPRCPLGPLDIPHTWQGPERPGAWEGLGILQLWCEMFMLLARRATGPSGPYLPLLQAAEGRLLFLHQGCQSCGVPLAAWTPGEGGRIDCDLRSSI